MGSNWQWGRVVALYDWEGVLGGISELGAVVLEAHCGSVETRLTQMGAGRRRAEVEFEGFAGQW